MKLKEIYSKPIERSVNPAVSATKFDKETEHIEIEEYVFTDEILNGLFRILNAIKNNEPYNHVGIWIDGYYGSGKSHFLKYLDYCITKDTQEKALQRFLDAVKAIDPMDDAHNLQFDYDDLLSIASWLKKATVDTCIFNLETSYDNSTDKKVAFLQVFWNEFNNLRGFNKFNISLAQNLEKPLQEKGVFEQFKQRIADEGGNWNDPSEAANIIDQELGWVLDVACELAPTLDKESIRQRIINRDTNISIDRFGMELASYLKDKGDNYRLIFLADEVSQFINKEKDRYLNLQEIITKLSEACQNKVWVACTAQQDLSELMDDIDMADEKDKEGKIKGRFEVNVSLKGTQPEVITQKRILDKKEEVKPMLGEMYDKLSSSFSLHFKLPNSYSVYDSKKTFIDYYPFVPYQFKLISQVFDSFLKLGYVAKEVKGNERSIIKVVHATAKQKMNEEVGKFIAFDELYNSMFEEGLQARGQKAITTAIDIARKYEGDSKLAVRIANTLFMICNISDNNKLYFPASVDNITSLLIKDVSVPRLTIKTEVEKILDYFCVNNIIRREPGKNGAPDTYAFQSEEEMKVAALIGSQTVDNNSQAEQLRDIIFKHFGNPKNKEQYKTRSFTVGATIKQRSFLSTNNPDVTVDFSLDQDYDNLTVMAMRNSGTRLIFYLAPQYRGNHRLANQFYWYCQVQKYLATPAPDAENAKIRSEFEKRAQEIKETVIAPELHKILDSCPVVSGVSILEDPELTTLHGADRYHFALQKHLGSIYTKAGLVDKPNYPHNSEQLRHAILRPIQNGDYEGAYAELTEPEREVEVYLNRQFGDVNVSDVVAKFAKAPYGWDNISTLYVINELVRRHSRDYSYSNNPNVDPSVVAGHLLNESNKFTLRKAQALPQELINGFLSAWKNVFGSMAELSTTDGKQLYRISRGEVGDHGLKSIRSHYHDIEAQYNSYRFVQPIHEATAIFDAILEERDTVKYFETFISQQDSLRQLIDTCKEVIQFIHDQMPKYKALIDFARDNKDNFKFVPADQQPLVEKISGIAEAEWPIQMREYIKIQHSLTQTLNQIRESKREQIRQAYEQTFDQLYQAADQQGVSRNVLANKDYVIQSRTASENILVLDHNLNTDQFYAEQSAVILRNRPVKPSGDDDGGEPKSKVRNCALQTRTTEPLKSEQDVDHYLAKLKAQIMSDINDGYEVIITK
ncbi:MAG: BREX system P-loop protein BrxC [Prevotella sp.]